MEDLLTYLPTLAKPLAPWTLLFSHHLQMISISQCAQCPVPGARKQAVSCPMQMSPWRTGSCWTNTFPTPLNNIFLEFLPPINNSPATPKQLSSVKVDCSGAAEIPTTVHVFFSCQCSAEWTYFFHQANTDYFGCLNNRIFPANRIMLVV